MTSVFGASRPQPRPWLLGLLAAILAVGCAAPTDDLGSGFSSLSEKYAQLRNAVERGAVTAADFPPIFDAAIWDVDPQMGNAIAGTEFTADGGRRAGILQLFIFHTLNLKAFLDQQEFGIQNTDFRNEGGVVSLTRSGAQARFTQTARIVNGQVIYTGVIVVNGATIVSFEQNLTTTAFDGEYVSPADRNTRHRVIAVPLENGNRIEGSAYDLLNDGRANYTHIGLFSEDRRPLRLLEFFQVDAQFDQTARELADKVAAAVAANGGEAEGEVGGGEDPGVEDPNEGEDPGAEDPNAGEDPGAEDPNAGEDPGDVGEQPGNGAFPPLLDLRFFQLDIASVNGPGNSGAVFGVVNAVAVNSVDELQRLTDSIAPRIEVDAAGRQVEVRRGLAGGLQVESRQTFVNGVQEGVITVGGVKRYSFVRNHVTGEFRGLIIAPGFDRSAPIAAFVRPNRDGTANHLIIEDLANNLTNDYRGELIVDARTLEPRRFVFFQQFNGGLAAQPESAALVRELGFVGVVRGF